MVQRPIKWSKDSENLEKSLLERNKEENQDLKAHRLQPLKQYCIGNQHNSIKGMTTWAQGHFTSKHSSFPNAS